ncbi:MAG TPA: hypothetical protein DCZ03_12835 [Gammaproteobacteria bacterium]|nr:hypothetical protein [Gammaproteobacteria bacterium]
MRLLAELCVVPMGVGVSVSKYIAECQKVLEQSGLEFELHAYGTNIEGEWDDVMEAVKKCHQTLHQLGVPRIHTTMKLGTRIDKSQSLQEKVQQVLSQRHDS